MLKDENYALPLTLVNAETDQEISHSLCHYHGNDNFVYDYLITEMSITIYV